MTKNYSFPLLVFLLWLIVFSFFRSLFWQLNHVNIAFFGWFTHSIQLDIAAACYLTLPTLFIWFLMLVNNTWQQVLSKIVLVLNLILLIAICLIEYSSIDLFAEWGTIFNLRAYQYLVNDIEAYQTIASHLTILNMLFMAVFLWAGYKLLAFMNGANKNPIKSKISYLGISILYLIGFGLGARGSISKIPIQVSNSFFSTDDAVNYLSVNKLFYFGNSLKQQRKLKIEDEQFTEAELQTTYAKLYSSSQNEEPTAILNSTKPNIILIVLEGCPADVFEKLGGLKEVTPAFNKLTKEGLLFTNIYSSGTRTDQGLLSILSGLPALPYLNIMQDVEQTNKFPSILKVLKERSYHTSFMVGASLNFSNLNNYFLSNGADKIIGKNDFEPAELAIEWGAPDNYLFKKAQNELALFAQPFFTTILTQSSHDPFKLEGAYKFGDQNKSDKFKSTIYFTDSCLGEFIKTAQSKKWYSNSIFIIVSDHGSMHLENRDFNDHKRFQVPLLIWGPALKVEYRGKEIDHIGNHHDIPTTILSMLNIKNEEFVFSKNLLAPPINNNAYWITEHTLGWITKQQRIVINHETKDVYFKDGDTADVSTSISDALKYYKMVVQYALRNESPVKQSAVKSN